MLSDYYKKIAEEYETKVGDVKKIIPNLGSKTICVLHYRDLQLYESGLYCIVFRNESDKNL